MRTTAVATRQAVKTNKLPQLQGGHLSHKTFSKSTPPVCPSQNPRNQNQNQMPQLQGGHESHKTPEEHPSSVSKSKKSNSKTKCKLANGSHQSRCIQFQDVQMYNVPRISRYVQDNEK